MQDIIGPGGQPGYHHAVLLAKEVVKLRNSPYVRPSQAATLITLWQKLSDRDKAPVSLPRRYRSTLGKGTFKAGKKNRAPGEESLKR